jgi:hypothetical protein
VIRTNYNINLKKLDYVLLKKTGKLYTGKLINCNPVIIDSFYTVGKIDSETKLTKLERCEEKIIDFKILGRCSVYNLNNSYYLNHYCFHNSYYKFKK